MANPDEEKYGIHVGNLRSDISYRVLKTKLIRFFNSVGVQIAKSDIDLHRALKSRNVYAYIYLADEYEYQFILDFFKAEGTSHLPELQSIAVNNKPVRVTRKHSITRPHPRSRSRSQLGRSSKSKIKRTSSGGTSGTGSDSEGCSSNNSACVHDNVTVKLPDYGSGLKHFNTREKRAVYVHGQTIGTESRVLEFKQGGGDYMKRNLKEHVSKYMVSFLNNQGGTLLIGVNDKGLVEGVSLNQRQEDKVRLTIDEAIKGIRPEVFPQMYSVHFVPVTEAGGDDYKVIEIQIQEGNNLQLYEDMFGDVYIRRDGSVQGPLRASQIMEWTRMTVGKENKELDTQIKALRSKERELMDIIKVKEQSEKDLQDKITRLKTTQTQSQICAIL